MCGREYVLHQYFSGAIVETISTKASYRGGGDEFDWNDPDNRALRDPPLFFLWSSKNQERQREILFRRSNSEFE